MGDNQATDFNDPAANAPDAAAYAKGKGKAAQAHEDVSMGEDEENESSEDEEEESGEEDDEEEGQGNLEPISADNIIDGGRRTRGKRIDFSEAAEKAKAEGEDPMDDEDEDDEDFQGEEGGDDHMQE
ncbi:histone chaperone domain CHZ-domain-containing protein [Talaromyces proteolyticus]|uniref:Histone chaperone domain CHZ-domain-containing protein n=1 Tax=Talaromyces proteolyticus TaxID=1131652 RepID=A0AAD4L4V9_9EURO|nr:histone chaperone domain CHZ-domain-containing protein [Talaromyces proteolyticus]KAH8704248.1 histone chaperone domain CHZ-domain-containing protein [Talaromyces proteolyticus]